MADLLLFGRLADARRAGQRRFRCFNAHLMHTVILGLQGKLVEITSLSLRIISLRSVAQLLKLSTICKSPLHGPRNYDDHTWKRSANYSARTDHGLKQFFLRISQQYYASPKKKEAHTICNNRPHTALSPVWFSESTFTQIQKNFVLASLPSQCFNPRQPAHIALNFPPNLFVRWESPLLDDLFVE